MKVLIGINTYPGHAHCRDIYRDGIDKMIAHAKKNDIDCEPYVVWNGNQPAWGYDGYTMKIYEPSEDDRGIDILVNKQNIVRDYFLKGDYDFLFMSETDTVPPEDTITSFVEYNKDIISSPYFVESQANAVAVIPLDNPKYAQFAKYETDKAVFQRNYELPCVWGLFGNQSRMWTFTDLLPQRGLVRCVATGIGACLIKRDVIKTVGEFIIRDGKEKHQQFTDFMFGVKSYQLGYEMFVDTDRISNHYHYDFDEEQIFTKWFNPKEFEFDVEANPFKGTQ